MKIIKTTPAQKIVLDNYATGKPADAGGVNYGGGLKLTLEALRLKGLIDDNGITDLGREAIKA